jgi:hypothetical protein
MEEATMEGKMNAGAPGVTTFTIYIPCGVTGHSVSDKDERAEA